MTEPRVSRVKRKIRTTRTPAHIICSITGQRGAGRKEERRTHLNPLDPPPPLLQLDIPAHGRSETRTGKGADGEDAHGKTALVRLEEVGDCSADEGRAG